LQVISLQKQNGAISAVFLDTRTALLLLVSSPERRYCQSAAGSSQIWALAADLVPPGLQISCFFCGVLTSTVWFGGANNLARRSSINLALQVLSFFLHLILVC
jgi:hypothetical protein